MNKVQEILKDIQSLTVLEANDLASAMEESLGFKLSDVLSGGGGAPAAAAAPAEAAGEKTFSIVLAAGANDANKLPAIKAVRGIKKELTLLDGKKLVEEGGELAGDLDDKALAEMKKVLEEAKVKFDVK